MKLFLQNNEKKSLKIIDGLLIIDAPPKQKSLISKYSRVWSETKIVILFIFQHFINSQYI